MRSPKTRCIVSSRGDQVVGREEMVARHVDVGEPRNWQRLLRRGTPGAQGRSQVAWAPERAVVGTTTTIGAPRNRRILEGCVRLSRWSPGRRCSRNDAPPSRPGRTRLGGCGLRSPRGTRGAVDSDGLHRVDRGPSRVHFSGRKQQGGYRPAPPPTPPRQLHARVRSL